jgi:hypothetical protein
MGRLHSDLKDEEKVMYCAGVCPKVWRRCRAIETIKLMIPKDSIDSACAVKQDSIAVALTRSEKSQRRVMPDPSMAQARSASASNR